MSPSSVVGGRMVKRSPHSSSGIVAQTVKGSHVLRIDGYSQTKGLGNGKFIKSDTFEIGGHLWYIRYYPDGVDTDDAGWIEFTLHLSHKSRMGANASYKFSLLDDIGEAVPSYSLICDEVRTFHSADTGWGFSQFLEQNALEQSAYLKDDHFSVRCDVTVLKEIRSVGTSQFVMVPPSDMKQHMGRLLSSGVEGDVKFQVGEETFTAHRLVLGARSSVFMAELLGPLKERKSCIRIDDMDPRVFKAMLHFIYTDSLPDMHKGDSYAMAQHLLVAADRYGLDRLKLICEDKLCSYINTRMAVTTLVLAEQHGCKGLKEACFNFLKSPGNLKRIMDSDEFPYLTSSCPSLLNELIANVAP